MNTGFNFDEYFNSFAEPKKTIKDIADQYPDPPKEKIVETTCPCCKKKLRLKVRM